MSNGEGQMKLVLIAYNISIDEEVMETLARCGIENYTKWSRVLGRGSSSGAHLDSHIWPGANSVLAVGLEEDNKADELLARLRKLKEQFKKEGVKAFVLPLLEIV
jgi:nitrogen regulatory protein PII